MPGRWTAATQSGVTEPERREGRFHTVGGLVQCVEACTGCGGYLHRGCLPWVSRPGQGRREPMWGGDWKLVT